MTTPPDPTAGLQVSADAAESVAAVILAYVSFCAAMPQNGGPGGDAVKEAWTKLEFSLMAVAVVWPVGALPWS